MIRSVRRALAPAQRIAFGPWPIYPRAITLIVLYSLIVRSVVRILAQPAGAASSSHMSLRLGAATVLATAVTWIGAVAVRHIDERIHADRPRGRVGYVASVLAISVIVATALVVMRAAIPDGAVETRYSVASVLISSFVICVAATFATNGLVGATFDRLRRQEEAVRADRSLLLASEERVRSETARYLHDAMQSTLLRASMRLAAVEREGTSPDRREQLRIAIDEIDQVREDGIRGAGRRLSPPLSSTGLIVALRELVAIYDGPAVAVDVHFDDASAERFRNVGDADRAALAVYRIVEQGLQNALKHARPEHVRVEVGANGRGTVVRVIDDGAGITAAAVPGAGSAVINAWLDDIGGSWELRSADGGGTVLEAHLDA